MSIPLSNAYHCLDCDHIGDTASQCSHCASAAVHPVAAWIDRPTKLSGDNFPAKLNDAYGNLARAGKAEPITVTELFQIIDALGGFEDTDCHNASIVR